MSPWALWLSMILLIGAGIAVDVPFVFDETSSGVASYNSDQLEQAYTASSDLAGVPMVTQATDDEVITFPVTGGGNAPEGKTKKNVGELKEVFNARVEPDNSRVHEEALVLVSTFPGDLTIDQISSIYSYLKNGEDAIKGWSYARDPRGIDYFMYANQSLRIGERTRCVGTGDCDDFAILMSGLIESIGGTTRIILARNNITGGHAYTEVYLGNLNAQNNQVEDIINWVRQKFNADKIFTHIDTATKDVWLNLDWGPDERGNTHPGGPFYLGDKHIVLCIRDRYEKTALKLSELFKNRDAWNNKGSALDGQGMHDEAIKAYDEAIRLDPKYAVAWYNKGIALRDQGKYDEAIKAYDEAIRLDPNLAEPWNNKGVALYSQGKYNEAIEVYDEAIKLDPKYVAAWYNKGVALYSQGKYNEAIEVYDEAIKLDPKYVAAWSNKGAALFSQGKYDEAIKAYDEAIRLDPTHTKAYYAKGLILKNLDKTSESNAAFAKANELGYTG